MAVGKLYTPLYLSILPDGWQFEVTKLDTQSYDGWYSGFDNDNVPYSSSQGDFVNACTLSTSDVTNSGPGPSGTLHFTVTTDSGKSKTGYLTFSSTDWGDVERPDYSLLTAAFDNQEAPPPVYLEVPDLLDPGNYYIGFSLDKNGDILMVAQANDPITNQLISDIVNGIITAFTDTLKWVVGELI